LNEKREIEREREREREEEGEKKGERKGGKEIIIFCLIRQFKTGLHK